MDACKYATLFGFVAYDVQERVNPNAASLRKVACQPFRNSTSGDRFRKLDEKQKRLITNQKTFLWLTVCKKGSIPTRLPSGRLLASQSGSQQQETDSAQA